MYSELFHAERTFQAKIVSTLCLAKKSIQSVCLLNRIGALPILTMDWLKLFRAVILFGLLLYFTIEILQSVEKLNKGAIGTSSELRDEKMILFPSVTICFKGQLPRRYPSIDDETVLDR